MQWWCLTGRVWFITSSSSLSSIACSLGKLWQQHNLSALSSVRHLISPVDCLPMQEALSHHGSALGRLLHRPSDSPHPRSAHWWEERFMWTDQQCCFCPSVLTMFSFCSGKYGSNIRPAFWRNIPFFVVPFWAASLLFSRPRVMPVITADKVSFTLLKYWIKTKCYSCRLIKI